MPPPVQTAEANSILQMLAGAGQPTPGAAPGGTPSPQAQALQGATQQLDGANPQGIATMLRQVNDALASAYLQAAMRIPDMAEDISKARAALERAIKKAQQAGQLLQQVQPIVNSAGVGPMSGPTPSAGGGPDISSLIGA